MDLDAKTALALFRDGGSVLVLLWIVIKLHRVIEKLCASLDALYTHCAGRQTVEPISAPIRALLPLAALAALLLLPGCSPACTHAVLRDAAAHSVTVVTDCETDEGPIHAECTVAKP